MDKNKRRFQFERQPLLPLDDTAKEINRRDRPEGDPATEAARTPEAISARSISLRVARRENCQAELTSSESLKMPDFLPVAARSGRLLSGKAPENGFIPHCNNKRPPKSRSLPRTNGQKQSFYWDYL